MPLLMYRVWMRICLFLAGIMLCAVPSYAATSEILILFDQTESILRYNTKLLSGLWVSNIILSFDAPNRITLVGFDYESHKYFSVVIPEKAELSSLSSTFDEIKLSGLATDIEVPFRYILERAADDSLKMVLLITDGEPDIWDMNIGFISPRVLADARYSDLNTQYHALKKTGLSRAELYNQMGSKYAARNLEFIEQAVSLLQGKLKMKLVIWDISGGSELLKRWAVQLNSIYIPLDITSAKLEEDVPREFLAASMKTATAIREETEPVLNQSIAPKPLPQAHSHGFFIFMVCASIASIFGLLLYRRRRSSIRSNMSRSNMSNIEIRDPVVGMVPVEAEYESVPDDISVPEYLTENDTVDSPVLTTEQRESDTDFDKDEILKFIDQRINSALNDTEGFMSDVFSEATAGLGTDKRLSLREQAPPGSIIVHWTDREGIHKSGSAINISMHGIMFAASNCDADSISCIEVVRKGIRINVAHSIITRRDIDKFVVSLIEFERTNEDKMLWIELQTRIMEEN